MSDQTTTASLTILHSPDASITCAGCGDPTTRGVGIGSEWYCVLCGVDRVPVGTYEHNLLTLWGAE